MLALCWAYVGLCWAYVGLCWPMLGHVEQFSELCWGHVWAIYADTILRCQFFCPGPPPGAQHHVKTDVFQHRQDEIPCRRRARSTAKNDVFLTPQAKYTVNYRDFSGSGGPGSAAGPAARYHRRPPARTRAVAGVRI